MAIKDARALVGASIDVATVSSVLDGRIGLRAPAFGSASARSALAGYEPRSGDSVLCATASDGSRFVIGVLASAAVQVRAADGTRAAVERDSDGQEILRVRSAEGMLLFEHRSDEGRSILRVPAGDLELRADAGDVALISAGKVRIQAAEGVELESAGPVSIGSRSGEAASELRLDADRTELSTRLFGARADRADVQVGEANLVARTLRTLAQRVRSEAEEVEARFGRVVERAREVYREAEEISQTRAGRLKLVADRVLSLLGESTEVKAREDVKIKGEKIYLG